MSPVRKRMLEEMQLRNLSEATIDSYVKAVWRYARHFKQSPDQLGPEQVHEYLLYLRNEKVLEHTASEPRRTEVPLLPSIETEVVRRRDCCAQTAAGVTDCPERRTDYTNSQVHLQLETLDDHRHLLCYRAALR